MRELLHRRCKLAVLCGTECWLKSRSFDDSHPLHAKIGCTAITKATGDSAVMGSGTQNAVSIKEQRQFTGPTVTSLSGAQCQLARQQEHPGGDVSTLKVSTAELCRQACDQDARCVSAAFCGGDTCFMKDRTASPAISNPICDTVISKPELLNNPWLPNDPDVEKIIEAIPGNTKNKHKQGAWELLKERIRYNARMWSKMGVTFPSQNTTTPLRILLLNSPCVLYGMDWHTGEHLQWGDIIYTLVRLGHKVFIPGKYHWKQWKGDHSQWDMILTDYGGVFELWRVKDKLKKVGTPEDVARFEEQLVAIRCKLRVLDTFGTDAVHNDLDRPKMSKKMPPALGIRLDQYWSYYPKVGPRSTFIGFTTTDHDFGTAAAAAATPAPERKWRALLWGKSPTYMGLERNTEWLQAISEHIDIVATIEKDALESGDFADTLPDFIENRGVLEASEYFDLLRSSALLIGVGQPFWGNAPLDALQQGVMTLMPSFNPPLGHCVECRQHFVGQDLESKAATDIKNKFQYMPNKDAFTSQNPYVEKLGEPDVYLLPLDIHKKNLTTVLLTLKRAHAEFVRRKAAADPRDVSIAPEHIHIAPCGVYTDMVSCNALHVDVSNGCVWEPNDAADNGGLCAVEPAVYTAAHLKDDSSDRSGAVGAASCSSRLPYI